MCNNCLCHTDISRKPSLLFLVQPILKFFIMINFRHLQKREHYGEAPSHSLFPVLFLLDLLLFPELFPGSAFQTSYLFIRKYLSAYLWSKANFL